MPLERPNAPRKNLRNDFRQFSEAIRKGAPYPKVLLAMDPGHTTGLAVFINGSLYKSSQIRTHPMDAAIDVMKRIISRTGWKHIVYENYRVYSDKRDQHVNSEVHTVRLIGVIETFAQISGVSTSNQMAATVKGFFTDERLRQFGYYKPGFPHANDAVRHGCYYLSYGCKPERNK
jgi:hypothetical protein